MKKNLIILCILLAAVFSSHNSDAQLLSRQKQAKDQKSWFDLMQDPDAKFRDVQYAFYHWWEKRYEALEREREKAGEAEGEEGEEDGEVEGVGYQLFKRWEYINRNRVQADGKLPAPDDVMKKYEQYISEYDATNSASGNWTFVGMSNYPANNTAQPTGMGRVNAIAFHPSDPNIIFIGAPSGGIWKTNNPNGNSTAWTNLCSNLPTLGVSSILIHPSDPDIIYIGTGDRDGANTPGIGVYKTTNGGTTWSQVSNGMGSVTVGAMLMLPGDPNTIIAATSGGLFKTTNGGANWGLKQAGNFKDLKFKPGDPTVVYAARYSSPAEFYRSANTGDSWTKNTSLPSSGTGSRSVLGVSANNPAYVYVLLTKTDNTFLNLYRSTDYGVTFTAMASNPPNILSSNCDGSGTTTQATYDLCMAVDPANVNKVIVGGVDVWSSDNGGTNWVIKAIWAGNCSGTAVAMHADHHVLEWSPMTNYLYDGHDGGISFSTNTANTWTEITGSLPITQIYKIGQGSSNVNYIIFGTQDNGCNGTMDNSTFYTTAGGDGGESVIDYANSNYCYNTYVGGPIRRSATGPLGSYATIANNGLNGIDEPGDWILPYLLDKSDHLSMFAGYKNIWRSNNITSSPPSFTKISSGETNVCTVIEQSSADNNILFVVREDYWDGSQWLTGNVKRSDNARAAAGSVAWTTITKPGGNYPSDLKSHPTDANIVYATAGSKVYKSSDKGATWVDISGNLPAISINCLVYDKNTDEGIYIGNQTGVWYKNAAMPNWILFSNGLPPADVRELEIYYDANIANNKIKAGTFGRGLWQSDLATVSVIDPTGFAAFVAGSTQINLSWIKNAADNNVLVTWSPTETFGQPVDGSAYTPGNLIPGGGIVLYSGSASTFNHTGLAATTTYYYKIWSVNGSNQYSAGLPPINATTYSHSWIGTISTNWFTPGNWGTNTVPTSTDNVYIPAGTTYMPEISASGATCANIIIESGASLTMNSSTAYTLSVSGDWTNNGTFTKGIGTVDFNGDNSLQQIKGSSSTTFYILKESKNSAGNMLEDISQIGTSNYLLISSGTFKLNNSMSSVTIGSSSSDRSITSTKGIWLNAGTMNCSSTLYSWGGNIKISGGVLDLSTKNLDYGYNGNIIIEGGLVKVIRIEPNSTGLSVNYTQTGGELIVGSSSSSSTVYSPFDLTNGSNFTLSGGTITVQRSSSFTSDYSNLASTNTVTGGTLQIGNSSTPASQTIRINSTAPVYNLVVNATNSPTAQLVTNGVTVKNDLTISGGTLDANNLNISVGGNWSNNGTFSAGSGTVTLNGTAAQNLTGNNPTTFNNLILNNGNGLTINGSVNATVHGTLTFTSGVITTGNNKVIIGPTGSVSRTSGHIYGNLQKNIGTGTAIDRTFEIGDAEISNYTPAIITFASVGTAGDLTANTTSGDHPNIGISTLNATKSVNRYWTLSNNGIVFTNYDAVFNFLSGDLDGSTNTANLIAGKYSSSAWTYPTVGTKTSTSTQITGVSTFSDFQLAEKNCIAPDIPSVSASNNTICIGESTILSITAGNLNDATSWQWYTGSCSETSAGSGLSVTVSPTVTTTYYVRGEGGCVTPGECVSITITVNSCAKASVAAGGNWSNDNTWNPLGVPAASDNATITSPGMVVVDINNAECNDLTIQSGSVLDITNQHALTVNGTLTNSDGNSGLIIESGGSLIENTTGVPATVKRDVSQGIWHLISVPNATTTANTFIYDYLQYWDETDKNWHDIVAPETSLVPMQGYGLWNEYGGTECVFAGNLNTGTFNKQVTVNGTSGENYSGANLLGNPYPCSVDWEGLRSSWGAVYYWNGTSYVSWNGSGSGSRYVPPMQGFFIYAPNAGTFSLSNANKAHSSTSFYKSADDLTGTGLVLATKGESYSDKLYIAFNESAGEGFDVYHDAYKLLGGTDGVSEIYSLSGDTKLSIDVRPACEMIPLGFTNSKSGQYQVGIDEKSGILKATLEDTKNGTFNDLLKGDYSFSYQAGESGNRFKLHLATVGMPDNENSACTIYSADKTVRVILPGNITGTIYLYDLAGQLIIEKPSASGQSDFTLGTGGIYLVKVITDNGLCTQKVWVR